MVPRQPAAPARRPTLGTTPAAPAPTTDAEQAVVSEQAPRAAWDRREGETAQAYAAFRVYRDLGPLRTVDKMMGVARTSAQRWSRRWDWQARAVAWDDSVHQEEDRARLEAIRTMHSTHQAAGRAAMAKALQVLNALKPSDVPATAAARLLEVGARLEERTLLRSVAELQGLARAEPVPGEDPFDAIAREFNAAH
jgi:hypothetical protein